MFVTKSTIWPTVTTALALLFAASPAAAQGPPNQTAEASDDDLDPPDRVGRLSYIEGAASFQPAGADQWALAEPNRPVTTGDRIWADSTGRLEVDAGAAVLRVPSFSELDLVRLDDHWLQVRLPQGSVIARVKVLSGDQDNEIDAPNAAVALLNSGEYRVDVSADGRTTTVTVWSGRAEVTASGSSFKIESGQVATITGDSSVSYDLSDAGPLDEFGRWSRARDGREDSATVARRYVSEDMPGEEDLDAYGRWEVDQSYGPVWYPTTVAVDWAPYRQGHWAWVAPWGWTWVDAAPWGFAPYHYGRWAYFRGRWGWCPGRTIVEPVYAPALVVFVGEPGWQTSVAFAGGGGVAWFPLAPGEVYYPAYRSDLGYRRRINVANVTNVTYITNVTNVTNITYRNRTVAGAVTAVPQRVFIEAQPVRRSVVTLSPGDLGRARVVGTAAPIAPTTASLAASVPGRRAPLPPTTLARRPVEATHVPPPAPVPFSFQQRAIAANGGRPLPPQQVNSMRPTTPAQPTTLPFRSAQAGPPDGPGLTRAPPGPATPPATTKATTPAPTAATPRPPARDHEPASPAPAARPPEAVRQATPTPSAPERGPAPPQAAAPAPAPPPPAAPPRPPATSLQRSYQAERADVEGRHRREFARPPAGETPDATSRRQDAEDRDLEQRYQRARATEAPAMPPKAASKPEARVQRPAPKQRPEDRKPEDRK